MKKELKIPLIKNGTVIDHITAGYAVKVLHILGIPISTSSVVSVAMNVKSKFGKKDIVKVENREIDPQEVDKIALIAPKATINIIRNYIIKSQILYLFYINILTRKKRFLHFDIIAGYIYITSIGKYNVGE